MLEFMLKTDRKKGIKYVHVVFFHLFLIEFPIGISSFFFGLFLTKILLKGVKWG